MACCDLSAWQMSFASPYSKMGYDTMGAWDKTSVEFNDAIQRMYVPVAGFCVYLQLPRQQTSNMLM